MKIVTVLGARPQFIKAGSISREVLKQREIKEVIVHTGQHYDANMSDIFFDEMEIPKPDYNLGIGGKSHGEMTGKMIEGVECILLKEKPDWLMVYGDTNSTLAGALAASKLHIKIAHVEAGLRSFNMKMPEEVNRVLTDRLSTLLFCPTKASVENLYREGFEGFGCRIVQCGDVMQDGAMYYKKLAKKPLIPGPNDRKFILCTVHRAENTDDPTRLASIVDALNAISKEKAVVLPLHPRTRHILKEKGLRCSDDICVIDPVGYLEMVWLIDNCEMVMSDSGGLQKEAFFFGKPCITLRDETEWVELVECGVNVLAGANKERILESYRRRDDLKSKDYKLNLYGGGLASRRIVKELMEYK